MKLTEIPLWSERVSSEWDYTKNTIAPDSLSYRSKETVAWVCSFCKGEFTAKVASRLRSKSCLKCKPLVSPQLSSSKVWKERLAKEWMSKNTLSPDSVGMRSKKRAWWKCSVCGYECYTVIATKARKPDQCAGCYKRVAVPGVSDVATVAPELVERWGKDNVLTPNEVSLGSGKEVNWVCERGHSFTAPVKNFLNGFFCSLCSTGGSDRWLVRGENDLATLYPSVVKYFSSANGFKAEDTFPKLEKTYDWTCELGHPYKRRLSKQLESQACPTCSGRSFLKGFNDLSSTHPHLVEEWDFSKNSFHPSEMKASQEIKVFWVCKKAGHKWSAQIRSRTYLGTGCPSCVVRSGVQEKKIAEVLKKLTGGEVRSRDRTAIAPYELDFYYSEKKLALEYNGDYWHSDKMLKAKTGVSAFAYHTLKEELCAAEGITLAFLWEADWKSEREACLEALEEYFTTGVPPELLRKKVSSLDEV